MPLSFYKYIFNIKPQLNWHQTSLRKPSTASGLLCHNSLFSCCQHQERNAEKNLTLTNTEYLGATDGTNPLSCRATILECNLAWILDLHLLSVFHAIRLHCRTSFIVLQRQGSKPKRICQYLEPKKQDDWYYLTLESTRTRLIHRSPSLTITSSPTSTLRKARASPPLRDISR
jgi:hypothetical protein